MVISFFGHADFDFRIIKKENLVTLLEELTENKKVDFYLGGYGRFDNFAKECCEEYCKKHSNAKRFFITPYIGGYLETRKSDLKSSYDEILYPPIENVPRKYAILKRNEWIIIKSDVVIFFVERAFGGANAALEFAKRKKKKVINLYTMFAK